MSHYSVVAPAPWVYEPCGDSDGETIGTDHFVIDSAGNEVVVAPDEKSGRLIAASPDFLSECESMVKSHTHYLMDDEQAYPEYLDDAIGRLQALIAKAKGA